MLDIGVVPRQVKDGHATILYTGPPGTTLSFSNQYWSLLRLLVNRFVPTGPIVLGIDDTIERRRGKRIPAQGISRDPVRRAPSPFVKASGLRWLSLML